MEKDKIIVILGPTSSGKSEVAISLAQKFDGEIISADSRQIYRGMNIGTGKVRGTWNAKRKAYISEKIPHHLIDIISPKTDFNVSKFKIKANKAIKDILNRNKLPIICGGTGFWIKALVDDVNFPEVKPDFKLREKLNKKSAEKLFEMLRKMDSERAKNIDSKNKVRLIRAIEICKEIGKVPKNSNEKSNYEFLQIGIDVQKEKLHENIQKRLESRFKKGMIKEVKNLHSKFGVSWKKLEMFGLEYRYISQFLQNKLSLNEMKDKLFQESKDYAKRQMTWFRKDSRIFWLKNYSSIEKSVQKFLH